ncbi:MAG: cupin domain-containing protein [Rubrivivax sp.]|nr:cupin domain-containing protein [Rubrivivax sp.]
MSPFFDPASTPWTELGDGIRRKIVGHTPGLMSVLVHFDKGAIGIAHAHEEHDQIAYVLSGAFEAEIDGQRRVLRAGEAFTAARLQLHGVVALEDNSVLLDQFTPRREDYLSP